MKRSGFIACFVFLATIRLYCQSSPHYIYGKVIDADTKILLKNVSISVNGTLNGAITDSSGSFRVSTPDKTVVLHFSMIGYTKRSVKVKEGSMDSVTVELSQKANVLMEVTVNASPIEIVIKSKRFHVLDYEFYKDNIVLITYVDLKKAKLVLIDQNFDTLGYKAIPYEPNRLFKDCMGNVHVVCQDSIYQVYHSGKSLRLLAAKSIRDFEEILLPCVAQDSSNFYLVEKYGSKLVDGEMGLPFYSNPLALSYVCINKQKRLKKRFVAIADEEKIKMSNDEAAFEARKTASGLATFGDRLFAEKNIFTEIYAPLFTIKNAIYVFDYVNGNIKCFDKGLSIKQEVPVLFHKDLQFQEEMQLDQITWNVFALFENDGITELRKVDLETGKTVASYKIPFAFVNHVKVRDNYIYFIRKGKDYDDTRYLSRLRIN
jgi:hypothetical protein